MHSYTKPRGQIPDYNAPVVMREAEPTIADFCNRIHKSLLPQLKQYGRSVPHSLSHSHTHSLSPHDLSTCYPMYACEVCTEYFISPISSVLHIPVKNWCFSVAHEANSQFFFLMFPLTLHSALVWGSSVRHAPQRVGKTHLLHDEDVVQIIKR